MDPKIENLKYKAQVFHSLLSKYALQDSDAESLLKWLTPLFTSVELGQINPPFHYNFRMALGKESEFFEIKTDVRHAEAEFMAALEDWESQDWYKQLKNN